MKINEKYKFVKPFIISAVKIVKEVTGIEIMGSSVKTIKGKISTGGTGMVLNVSGDVEGTIVYEFSRDMTMELSTRMVKKNILHIKDSSEFKALLESAIHELGNLITGKAITLMYDAGTNCEITPPQPFVGKDNELVPKDILAFAIELTTQLGLLVITISLDKSK